MVEDDNFQALSDLMSAMLFVFIITLIAYIINFSANSDAAHSQGQEAPGFEIKQSDLVDRISKKLSLNEIRHTIDLVEGTISISSDQLGFNAGVHRISSYSRGTIEKVADIILKTISCDLQKEPETECKKGFITEFEQVHVEGHTDNVPFRPRNGIRDNMDLSLLRAASVKKVLERDLGKNKMNEKVIFVPVGYGASKPILAHNKPTDEPRNRRIDFRFSLSKGWEHRKSSSEVSHNG